MEVWKRIDSIEGFEEYHNYEVSNHGRVRNCTTSRIIKPRVLKSGYLLVGLRLNGVNKDFYLHRLVALAFIPNPNNFADVDHINSDKTNNAIDNLQWLSHESNVKKSNNKQVFCVELNRIFDSAMEAGRQLGLNQSNISRCCNGKRKTCGGFHWRFIDISS
jgi:hypothetical protein